MTVNFDPKVPAMRMTHGLNQTTDRLSSRLEHLASGRRINKAADGAAALAISQEMSAQVRALSQAQRNTMDGVSMVQTAEGGLQEVGGMLSRMRELALQSANGTLGDEERAALDGEYQSLRAEIDRVSQTTEFNGQQLLDGSAAGGIALQVGTGAESADQINVAIGQMDSTTLGDGSETIAGQSLASSSGALSALSTIDGAIEGVNQQRTELGAVQNALVTRQSNLANIEENTEAARSRIVDADVAEETSARAREQILMQSASSVIAQATQLPQTALALLG